MATPLTLPNNPFAQPDPQDLPIDPRAVAFAHQPGDQVPNFAAIPAANPAPNIGAAWMADLPPTSPPPGLPASGPPSAPVIQGVDPTANFRQAPPAVAPQGPRQPAVNPDAGINAAGADLSKALAAEGEAAKAAAEAEAQARRDGAQQLAEQQRQLREQQVQRDQAVRQLNDDTKAAYEKAHNTVIPNFWEGHEGAAAGAAVLVGLGAVGRALTAFGTGTDPGNGAQQIINHAVDSFYDRKKEEINNLYRYADAKGKLNEQQKLDWATKLNDLQFQMAFTHQSIQDHIAEVNAQSKGRIDQTHFAQLSAENGQRTQQQLQAAQLQRAQINHLRNEDSIGFANAKTARIAAENKAAANTENGADKIVRDPETGRAVGLSPAGRGGAQKINEQNRNLKIADDKLSALLADMKANPGRLVPGTDAAKRREALYADALGANISATTLPANEESMHLEQQQLGNSGAGVTFTGANPEAVENRLKEIRQQRQMGLTQVEPLPRGFVDRVSDTPQQAPGISQRDAAKEWLAANPNDPRAPKIRQKLGL